MDTKSFEFLSGGKCRHTTAQSVADYLTEQGYSVTKVLEPTRNTMGVVFLEPGVQVNVSPEYLDMAVELEGFIHRSFRFGLCQLTSLPHTIEKARGLRALAES